MLFIPDIIFGILMAGVLLCVAVDLRRRRILNHEPGITVIIPCYNDTATVRQALRSVFASYPADKLDVIAVDDCSTDDSQTSIRSVMREHEFRLQINVKNKGKVSSLNDALLSARHELLLFLDADTMINPKALRDMLARMEALSNVAAVSCPYRPANKGFLAGMQGIEYSMLRIVQGAGNVTSVLALWGGCLLVRRKALEAVGGFSKRAITEDVELAFKLNQAGWKVEQSFEFVDSYVPDTLRQWFRQKLRWTAGGFQCILEYPKVWLCNPIQVMFISAYTILALSRITVLSSDYSMFHIAEHVGEMLSNNVQWINVWKTLAVEYGEILPVKIGLFAVYNLLSVIYIIPSITTPRKILRLALIIPFSMGYFPLYILVSFFGLIFWFFALRRLPATGRAW